jgi:hypothetical protein
VSLTVKQLAESLVKHSKVPMRAVRPLKWLAEMDGMDVAPASLDAPPVEDADPKDALDQAFIDAAVAEMKECMDAKGDPARLKKCLGKLKKMLQAHAEITAEDEGDDTDDQHDADDEAAEATGEGRDRHSGAVLEAIEVCREVSFTGYTTDDLETIAATRPERRKAVAESLKRVSAGGTAAAKPTSTGRGRISESVSGSTSTTAEAKPPTDARGFADYIRDSQN